MNTAAEVKRARVLLHALQAAKEWRETFEDEKYQGDAHEQVEFSEVRMAPAIIDTGEGRSLQGFDGSLALMREDAIAMMNWLEAYAREELGKIGVKM